VSKGNRGYTTLSERWGGDEVAGATTKRSGEAGLGITTCVPLEGADSAEVELLPPPKREDIAVSKATKQQEKEREHESNDLSVRPRRTRKKKG